jgi:hypothetical protein
VSKARHAGTDWTGFAGRHCGRAKALLVALPLLLISLLLDHGLAGTAPSPRGIVTGAGQASDVAGTEGKAYPIGRAGVAAAEPLGTKPKLSGDGIGQHGVAPSATLVLPRARIAASPGRALSAPAMSWQIAASPRAPPAVGA